MTETIMPIAPTNAASQASPAPAAPAWNADLEVLGQAMHAVPELVVILNSDRKVVFANKAVLAFLREAAQELAKDKFPGDIFACQNATKHPAGCGSSEECQTCGALKAILEAQGGHESCQECRISRCSPVGFESLDLKVCTTPLISQGQNYVLLVAEDISGIKRRQVLERLFFHDILNTAGSLQGLAGLLVSGDFSVDDVKDDLASVSDTLVNEIRSQRMLVAAENNELALELSRIQSLDLLNTIAQAYKNHQVAVNKHICVAPDAEGFVLISDAAILGRIVGNLLKNALEASSAGETVTVGCRRENGRAVFWCQNPKVMPREVQLQMFQRSFSTKGKGRGIGTYSIKLLTERYLKGKVDFTSVPETGTTFFARIPLAEN